MAGLKRDYPWIEEPLVACGPMRLIALAPLAAEISKAGGLGFIGAGNDASDLDSVLREAKSLTAGISSFQSDDSIDCLPCGVGFLLWAGDKLLEDAIPLLEKYRPVAVWLFAPSHPSQLVKWTEAVRRVTGGKTKIWIQIGTVRDSIEVTERCRPDVLVVQGSDAGGHGLQQCAGLISLLPEVDDALTKLSSEKNISKPTLIAAGGVMDGRGAAATLLLGASGVVLGTRYLASPEANIAKGYQNAVLNAADGGVNTRRSKLYDTLRGTTDWPQSYGGRGVLNESWHDAEKGLSIDENKRLYEQAIQEGDEGWGEHGRLTTYAGTGIGLVKDIHSAGSITRDIRSHMMAVLKQSTKDFS